MPGDVQILAPGVSAAPLTYTIPATQEILLKALFASFDGSASASAFLPCVRIVAPSGVVVGEYITDTTVAAGGSAGVSFAPFLRKHGGGSAAAATADYVSAPRAGYTQYDDVGGFSYPADYLAIGNAAMFQDDGSGRPEIIAAGLYEFTLIWSAHSAAIPAAVLVEIIAHFSNPGFPNDVTDNDPGNFAFAPGTAQGGGTSAWTVWQIGWLNIVTPPCTVWFTIQTTGATHTAFTDAEASLRIVRLTEASSQGL